MRKVLGIGVLAMSWVAFVMPAAADDGWYVSGNVGGSSRVESSVSDTFTGGSVTGDVDFDGGYVLSGAIGHAWGPFRLEGELSYRENDLDQIDVKTLTIAGVLFTALGTANLGGDTSSFGFMANGYYDFDTGSNWVPFAMAGIGGASLNVDITSVAGVAVTYDESDTVLAYQGGAGIGYKFSPNTTANLQYRLFGTADPTYDDGVDKIDDENLSHNFLFGITHRF